MSLNKRFLVFALSAIVSVGMSRTAPAQDAPKDDALDRLLEKAQDPKPVGDAEEPANESKQDAKADKPAAERSKAATKSKDEPADKALDDLLEKLGQTGDEPETTGRPKPPTGDQPKGEQGPADKPKQSETDTLDPQKRPLDEHLEELTGRKRKRPQDEQDQGKSDPSEGALSEAIKKMREVEKRLGQEDTGQETREKQEQIVKELDQMIKLARQMNRGQQGQRGDRRPGEQQQPGDEQNNPNDPQRGTNAQKPKKPTGRESLANNKDIWGHLPPDVRAELDNMFKEEALPMKRGLIDRYYLSVSRKSNATPDQ